jgi:hypothetical protein
MGVHRCAVQELKEGLPAAQRDMAAQLLRPIFSPLDAAFCFHDSVGCAPAAAPVML